MPLCALFVTSPRHPLTHALRRLLLESSAWRSSSSHSAFWAAGCAQRVEDEQAAAWQKYEAVLSAEGAGRQALDDAEEAGRQGLVKHIAVTKRSEIFRQVTHRLSVISDDEAQHRAKIHDDESNAVQRLYTFIFEEFNKSICRLEAVLYIFQEEQDVHVRNKQARGMGARGRPSTAPGLRSASTLKPGDGISPYLGLEIQAKDDDRGGKNSTLLVKEVKPGSHCESLGVKLKSKTHYTEVLKRCQIGRPVDVVLVRNRKKTRLSVEVGYTGKNVLRRLVTSPPSLASKPLKAKRRSEQK